MGILLPIVRGGAWIVTGCCGRTGAGRRGVRAVHAADVGFRVAGWLVEPGLPSVQSAGAGRASKPSTSASGITMLIRFSTFVSSSPWSRLDERERLALAPMRAVRPTRWT